MYRDNRPPRFQRFKAPDKGELGEPVQLISQRVGRCLERQGLLERDGTTRVAFDPVDFVARLGSASCVAPLKRVFSIDIEVCGRCSGSVRVIACIEDQNIIDKVN